MSKLESAKHQPYTYSLKTAAFANNTNICNNGVYMYLVPPKNALSIENMWTHINFQFDAGIPSGQRVITNIGISAGYPLDFSISGSTPKTDGTIRKLPVNWAADPTTRIIDKRIDLSSLLRKDVAGYRDFFLDFTDPDEDYTYIWVEFGVPVNTSITGKMNLWKADALYTTIGIQ